MRIVLDTNVIVSAMLSPSGTPAQLLARIRQRDEIVIVTSEPLLAEYRRVLSYPKLQGGHRLTPSQISQLVLSLRSQGESASRLPDVSIVDADPDDNHVFACALAGGADFVVSGDRHLLEVQSYQGIRVISPAALLLMLTANEGS